MHLKILKLKTFISDKLLSEPSLFIIKLSFYISIVGSVLIVLSDYLTHGYFIFGTVTFIILSIISSVYLSPYVHDYFELIRYLKKISLNRMYAPPKFKSKGVEKELAEYLKIFHLSWERAKLEFNQKIAERDLLFNTIPDVILVANENTEIISENKQANVVFGKGTIGKNLLDVCDDIALDGIARMVLHDKKGRVSEVLIGDEIKKYFIVKCEYYSIFEIPYCVLVMQDTTEIRRVEKLFSDFVTNVSHEIKTPLASIMGIAETLKDIDEMKKKDRDNFIPMLGTQAIRMKELVNDLLSLALIEKQQNSYPTEKVNLVELIDDVVLELEWMINENQNNLVIDVSKNLPKIIGDVDQIRQVITNLISNAIKYGKSGQNLLISAAITESFPKDNQFAIDVSECLVFSVIDQGVGIPQKYISRLTERFYRIDKSRSKKVGGTGLGLSIVKQILTRHHAFLSIESTEGKGSKFSVYFTDFNG